MSEANPAAQDLVTITRCERLMNSVSGNPRYKVHLESGKYFYTLTDHQVNYKIINSQYIGVPVLITLDLHGYLIDVTLDYTTIDRPPLAHNRP